jgi:hypothetical protein
MSMGVFIATHCQGEVGTGIENTVAPSVTGTMTVGETVTVSLGTWTGATALAGSLRHVSDDTEIDTFTADGTYLLADTDFGEQLYVYVVPDGDALSAVASAATAAVLIADMQLWLDGSDASTLFQDDAGTTPAVSDADPVGYIADKSGNARHVTQATAGNKPQLKLAIQNSRSVLRFATDDFMSIPAFNFTTMTCFIVNRYASGNSRMISFALNTGNDYGSVEAVAISHRELVKNSTDLYILGAFPSVGFNITRADFGGGNARYFRNGVSVGTDTYTNQTEVNPQLGRLGCGRDAGANAFFLTGDIAEVMFFSRLLSDAESTVVRDYLNAKWAVF